MNFSSLRLQPTWLVAGKSFAYPDWPQIAEWFAENVPPEHDATASTALARDWLQLVAAGFAQPMQLRESPHFLLLMPGDASQANLCLHHLEDYRTQISHALDGISSLAGSGKSVVLITPDVESFTRYLGDYYPDGDFMMPGGVCLDAGYTHFVLPDTNLTHYAPVLAHELCHVFLRGTNWPLWLEEAVVQTVEHRVARSGSYVLDRETVRRHREFWTPAIIQDFWTGSSFHRPDEGSELSYHLALFLLNAVGAFGREGTLAFLHGASRDDAGFASFHEVTGASPSEVLSDFLGPGDWSFSRTTPTT